jgi:hypothetical protein
MKIDRRKKDKGKLEELSQWLVSTRAIKRRVYEDAVEAGLQC